MSVGVDRYRRIGGKKPVPPVLLKLPRPSAEYQLTFYLIEDDLAIEVSDGLSRQVVYFDNRVKLEQAWEWVQSQSLIDNAQMLREVAK